MGGLYNTNMTQLLLHKSYSTIFSHILDYCYHNKFSNGPQRSLVSSRIDEATSLSVDVLTMIIPMTRLFSDWGRGYGWDEKNKYIYICMHVRAWKGETNEAIHFKFNMQTKMSPLYTYMNNENYMEKARKFTLNKIIHAANFPFVLVASFVGMAWRMKFESYEGMGDATKRVYGRIHLWILVVSAI